MKRLISSIFVLSLCLSIFSFSALADDSKLSPQDNNGSIVPLAEVHCTSDSRLFSAPAQRSLQYYDYVTCSHGKSGYIHRIPHYVVSQYVYCNVCTFNTTLQWYETGGEECVLA